jgi:hypothetical protein
MNNHVLSIILAIVSFIIIAYLAFKTDLLKEQPGPGSKYSFHRFQLWIWTLVICPIFCLHWGYVLEAPLINNTSLILLGIASGTLVTGAAINEAQKKDQLTKAQQGMALQIKATSRGSAGFFIDILTDNEGQLSVARLQNFIFTLAFVAIYVSWFFGHDKAYIDWDKDATPFVLMGISSGSYLVAKTTGK